MKLLFICNQGKNRSRTAEALFSKTHTTRSRGLYNDKPVSQNDLEWADLIIVMEEAQRKELGIRFPKQYLQKRILCWSVPDIYQFGDAKLKDELTEKMNSFDPALYEC